MEKWNESGLTVLNHKRCGHALDKSATRATLEALFTTELSRSLFNPYIRFFYSINESHKIIIVLGKNLSRLLVVEMSFFFFVCLLLLFFPSTYPELSPSPADSIYVILGWKTSWQTEPTYSLTILSLRAISTLLLQ